MKPVIAITVGDCNGIGPEVVLKSLRLAALRQRCRPVLVGPPAVFLECARRLGLGLELRAYRGAASSAPVARGGTVAEIVPSAGPSRLSPGRVTAAAGRAAVAAIEQAAELVSAKEADALVTAPLSKNAVHRAGYAFPGQTEFLAKLSGSERVAMMMVSRALTVGLVTIHVPLRRVAPLLTARRIREAISTIVDSLRRDFQIESPAIAVLGLNPHAGEGGDFGLEDTTVIAPALRSLRASGARLEGPLPADGLFARYRPGRYDAVVAMYHDQGLIPFKLLARNRGVNFTAGLSMIRTSPAHGTAFDIAGTGTADPTSMAEAIRLAARLAGRRRIDTEGTQR